MGHVSKAKVDGLHKAMRSDEYVDLMSLGALTRAQRKSLQEVPWTPGPRNAWQRFVRKAVG